MSLVSGRSAERVALVTIAAGVAVAVAMVLLAGFVGSGGGPVAVGLYFLAWLLPLLGGGIVLVVVLWAYGRFGLAGTLAGQTGSPERLTRPIRGARSDPRPVGDDASRQVARAARARYDAVATEGGQEIRNDLAEGAVRVARTTQGLDTARAGEAVRKGTWTDDPVAAAFLGEPSYPLVERLRGALDPAAAYRRRLRRTVAAIELLDGTVGGDGPPAGEDER